MTLSLSRRGFIASTAALSTASLVACASEKKSDEAGAGAAAPVPSNPLVEQRADPHVTLHDGWYYLTGSVPEYDRLVLRRSRTLAGLATAEERVLWRHEKTGPMSGFLWAPELHMVDGKWVIYFAAGPSGGGEDVFRIRTYVVTCDSSDPMSGNWTVLGQFKAPWDSFNLDATSFVHRDTRYLVWAQREPGIETNSNLYIAPMADALTMSGKATRLTVPTLDWEIQGYKVAEGAAILARNGRIFMTYSASATDARYCMGLLTASEDSDLMDPNSWTKSEQPVFVTSKETSVYGPGHNSFTIDEQGRDVLVYHGRDYEAIKGDPLLDPNRHARVQRVYYKPDGTPDFGIPVGNGPLPDRFSPDGSPDSFIIHDGRNVTVGQGALPSTQFRALPAKAGAGSITLSPIDLPDHFFMIGADNMVQLVKDDGSPDFARRSAFVREDSGKHTRFTAVAGGTLAARDGTLQRVEDRAGAESEQRFTVS